VPSGLQLTRPHNRAILQAGDSLQKLNCEALMSKWWRTVVSFFVEALIDDKSNPSGSTKNL
jgi:hypothetical protein